MTRRTIARLAVLLCLGALAGCTSTSTAGPAGNAGGNQAAGQPAAGGNQAAPKSVTCKQLPNDAVQGLMTNPVTGDDVSPVGVDSDGQQCVFHDADSSGQAVDIIVVPASDPAVGYDVATQHATSPVPLTVVGDRAFRETCDFSPYAEHGGVMCTVSIGTSIQLPDLPAITDGHSPTFTEDQNTLIALALGTVCNRIFGTGNTTPDLSGLSS